MSIFSRLFGRKGSKDKKEFNKIAQAHARAWSNVTFAQDAHKGSAQAYESMQRYINDNTLTYAERNETLRKVSAILESFKATCALTNEPINADMMELLRYSIIGWTTKESHPLLGKITQLVQRLLQNTSILMDNAHRKGIMSALLECYTVCSMRLQQDGFDDQQLAVIDQMIQGVQVDIQSNVGGERVLDDIGGLKNELNRRPIQIQYPTFKNYTEFKGTVSAAINAINVEVKSHGNALAEIQKNMKEILDTYNALPEDDSRISALEREYENLKTSEAATAAIVNMLSDRENQLITLQQSIAIVDAKADLSKYPEFLKLLRDTTYREVLSASKYNSIMVALDVIKQEVGGRIKPSPIIDPIPTKEKEERKSSLREAAEAQKAKKQDNTTVTETTETRHTLK